MGKTLSPLPPFINRYYGAYHYRGFGAKKVSGREGKNPHEYRFLDSG